MKSQKFPHGWDQKRIQRLLEHYENLSEDKQVAEDEAALEREEQTVVSIPTRLLPALRVLMSSATSGHRVTRKKPRSRPQSNR